MAPYKPKADRREASPTKRADVYGRWREGYSIPQIIKLEHLHCSTIRSIVDRDKQNRQEAYYNKPRSGAKPKTTKQDDRAVF